MRVARCVAEELAEPLKRVEKWFCPTFLFEAEKDRKNWAMSHTPRKRVVASKRHKPLFRVVWHPQGKLVLHACQVFSLAPYLHLIHANTVTLSVFAFNKQPNQPMRQTKANHIKPNQTMRRRSDGSINESTLVLIRCSIHSDV